MFKGKRGRGPVKQPTKDQIRIKQEEDRKERLREEESEFAESNIGIDNVQSLKIAQEGFEKEWTEKELEEEMPQRFLVERNPQAPLNIASFHFRDRVYKRDEQVDQMVVHFSVDGYMLQKDSQEERDQQEFKDNKKLEADLAIKAGQVEGDFTSQIDEKLLRKSLRNQFNYSERMAQSINNVVKERGVSTAPPPMRTFSENVTQWDIFDTYSEEMKREERESLQEHKEKKATRKQEDTLYSSEMRQNLKLMERMVNLLIEDDAYADNKYYEDKSDEFVPNKGSLLPLWRFVSERSRKKHVTALSWNPRYHDLFAVGYGYYDFMKGTGTGLVCCYSLKNTNFPEYSFTTESGVMCLHWHPQRAALLAIGLYDGTVLVYDVRNKHNRPIYQSTVRTNKHTDPVWQVYWQDEDIAKNINFYSISSDGRVTNWILMKNKLEPEEVMKLKLVSGKEGEPEEETSLVGLAGGMCFDFNRHQEHLFIVGTEEGRIHKCSKAYSGQYLETYEGHQMAVYTVKWNSFHPKIFISCSADWTVKIWDHNIKNPIMTFDQEAPVGDVAWAPYSSTVFACVTANRVVPVYDLSVEKHEFFCNPKASERAKLTHIGFNPTMPSIIVGDDRGGVTYFKLSPNLRKTPPPPAEEAPEKAPEKVQEKTPAQLEIDKMETLLLSIDKEQY